MRVLCSWVFFIITCLLSTMILFRVDFLRRMFIEGVSPFEGTMK